MKYHEKTAHSIEVKSYPFSCEHVGCNMKFKSKKEKLLHHNICEPECKNEKNSLVRLIDKFKYCILFLIENYGIDQKRVENLDEYVKLQDEFNETKFKLYDTEYFFSILGENFELSNNSVNVQQTK